ncbi:hypothetical protein P9112_010373 [Eukaryota sp. TZLM1-RC]
MAQDTGVDGFNLEPTDNDEEYQLHCIQVKVGNHNSKLTNGNFDNANDRTNTLSGIYNKYKKGFQNIVEFFKQIFPDVSLTQGNFYLYSNKELSSHTFNSLPPNFNLMVGESFWDGLGLSAHQIDSLGICRN